MMSIDLYAAYVVACLIVILIPGPTVTLVVANSVRHGLRAGLLNVAGTQLGLAAMIAAAGAGLSSAMAALGPWFGIVRLAGAAYLVWMGWTMLRAARAGADGAPATVPRGGFFGQGLLVALSNPKTLLFFGAFFPQFIDPAGDHDLQIAVMGATAMAFAALSDTTYAVVAARAGRFLSGTGARRLSRLGGGCLIGGGVWLALARG